MLLALGAKTSLGSELYHWWYLLILELRIQETHLATYINYHTDTRQDILKITAGSIFMTQKASAKCCDVNRWIIKLGKRGQSCGTAG